MAEPTFPEFDRSRLALKPLAERIHDLDLSIIKPLEPTREVHPDLEAVARKVVAAKAAGAGVILMIGGHVVRAGVQKYIIDLMEQGYISCLAMNGAVVIHDFELALIGATTESVAKYIRSGQFGLWQETGKINDAVNRGAEQGRGLGESVGRHIERKGLKHKDISLLAAAWRLGVPATVHVGLGHDIIHEHPNFDGAAVGRASYRDFLRFAHVVERLEQGVVMNFGSAVMAPEVYLKALAMARNVAHQEGRSIRRLTSLVCDLADLPEDVSHEADKSNHLYYFRPWKTMLVRTVADGGASYFVRGDHAWTAPQLWTGICKVSRR